MDTEKVISMSRDGPYRSPEWQRPPGITTCSVCGEALGTSGWVITDHPAAAHLRCVNWTTRRFPYDDYLERLRTLRRALARAIRVLDEVGIWLRAAAERWPRDARQTVEELAKRQRLVETALMRLKEHLRI